MVRESTKKDIEKGRATKKDIENRRATIRKTSRIGVPLLERHRESACHYKKDIENQLCHACDQLLPAGPAPRAKQWTERPSGQDVSGPIWVHKETIFLAEIFGIFFIGDAVYSFL